MTLIAGMAVLGAQAQEWKQAITLKTPGNPSVRYELNADGTGKLQADKSLGLDVQQRVTNQDGVTRLEVELTAKQTVYFNFEQSYVTADFSHQESEFLMPGFWYHKNLRSPVEAPSFATSDSWQVREDRLSTPLTGIFNAQKGAYVTVLRTDELQNDAMAAHQSGEVILNSSTDLGFTGFKNDQGKSALVFGFPYHEAPKAYIRKLTLVPELIAFEKLEKGQTRTLTWEIKTGHASDYADFIEEVWNYSYDRQQPQIVEVPYTAMEAKEVLSNFFRESLVTDHELKYYSGVHLRTDDCLSTGSAEVGFVGRTLLNAYNALEYAEQTGKTELAAGARAIFDSYLKHGFTADGFFREFVNFDNGSEPEELSIRRQSEGVFAVLNYLRYEQTQNRSHPEWESRIKDLLANFKKLQQADGSYPRKFDTHFAILDSSGGSTPSATLPLTMAYAYFKDQDYLRQASKSAEYLEQEIISKSDYFSSTLDANCEDKEASLYASTAMYYMAQVTEGKQREHYVDQALQAAYFCLSWYYTWDVPFAQGQMLGDVGFKTRGWGNVSVENNHVDVFIFEFATVLDWLAKERELPRFSAFSEVIKESMLQLMPVEGNMFNIAKVGYYPEVVQHTNWDYGKNGKGFYNDIFAPGWTVASLWQMLSPTRVDAYFQGL